MIPSPPKIKNVGNTASNNYNGNKVGLSFGLKHIPQPACTGHPKELDKCPQKNGIVRRSSVNIDDNAGNYEALYKCDGVSYYDLHCKCPVCNLLLYFRFN